MRNYDIKDNHSEEKNNIMTNKYAFFGSVKTSKYSISEGKLRHVGFTSNTGIAMYICEYLIKIKDNILPEYIRHYYAKILYEKIINNSVKVAGINLWCWEKTPTRSDYSYPPDWDDICKGIDAVSCYHKTIAQDNSVKLPSIYDLEEMIKPCLYHSKEIGEDYKQECKNTLALMMFVGGKKIKGNNIEDIMVTAVVIKSILNNYLCLTDFMGDTIRQLFRRLVEAAEIGVPKKIPFCLLSRCYLSWGMYLILLLEISNMINYLSIEIRDMIYMFLIDYNWDKMLPDMIKEQVKISEKMLIKLLEHRSGMELHDSSLSSNLPNDCASKSLGILYRHRRLNHYFGSSGWSIAQKLYIKSELNGCNH